MQMSKKLESERVVSNNLAFVQTFKFNIKMHIK